MDARGYNGQVHFDGQFVTIARKGVIARAIVGKGEKRIPLAPISAVQWKPATRAVRGYIQGPDTRPGSPPTPADSLPAPGLHEETTMAMLLRITEFIVTSEAVPGPDPRGPAVGVRMLRHLHLPGVLGRDVHLRPPPLPAHLRRPLHRCGHGRGPGLNRTTPRTDQEPYGASSCVRPLRTASWRSSRPPAAG